MGIYRHVIVVHVKRQTKVKFPSALQLLIFYGITQPRFYFFDFKITEECAGKVSLPSFSSI